jgi:hypothetical protein
MALIGRANPFSLEWYVFPHDSELAGDDSMLRLFLAVIVFVLSIHPAMGQSPPAKEKPKSTVKMPPKKEEKPPFATLPKPFGDIEGNLHELEEDGLFKIVEAKFDFISDTQDQGLSWTLEVQRRATFRRATMLLKNLRDARFYHLAKKTGNKLPIHNTVLEYPGILDQAAAQGKTLVKSERFRVWVPLTDVEARRVVGLDANLLELGRMKSRRR